MVPVDLSVGCWQVKWFRDTSSLLACELLRIDRIAQDAASCGSCIGAMLRILFGQGYFVYVPRKDWALGGPGGLCTAT